MNPQNWNLPHRIPNHHTIYQSGDPYLNSDVQPAEMRSRQGCFKEESLRLQGNQHVNSGCADHCHPGMANNHSCNVPTRNSCCKSHYVAPPPHFHEAIHSMPPSPTLAQLFPSESPVQNAPQQPLNLSGLSQGVERFHLTPSRLGSVISWATTQASSVNPTMGAKKTKRAKKKTNHDRNPNFANICTYIEYEVNYDHIFCENTKTSIREKLMTRTAAYELFSGHLNSLNPGLELNGQHCTQRLSTYKKKYVITRDWAGLNEDKLGMTMSQKLDMIFPCFKRMDQIFGNKPNIESLNEFDSSLPATIIDVSDLNTSNHTESGLSEYELQKNNEKKMKTS
ncbi:hypothetical protein O181_000370 [Austropuccinia psidii MF-1]|uniref:Uncharacterized protein n=1 Tax=Austropuccinia psidii MF-1 TaxID=1389203 RepID=A0A9Q3B8T0_9BASI|nr:hypothetical protein [Austropuccinia psidii MF-1]